MDEEIQEVKPLQERLNVELLDRVVAHVQGEPNRLLMGDWVRVKNKNWARYVKSGDVLFKKEPREFPACNTVACIAGWTVLLSDGEVASLNYKECELESRARELLGLTLDEGQLLFYRAQWPTEFDLSYNDDGSKESADLLKARVEFFKEKGR